MNPRNDRNLRAVRTIERTGKTVEEAVRAAMQALRVGRDEIEVEVLEEGRGGFLGLGAKEARIRARVRTSPGRGEAAPRGEARSRPERGRGRREPEPSRAPVGRAEAPRAEAPAPRAPRSRSDSADRGHRGGREDRAGSGPRSPRPPRRDEGPVDDRPRREPRQSVEGDLSPMIQDFATGLLTRLGAPSNVRVEQQDSAYAVSIESPSDPEMLVGRGGETLDAIQHVLLKMAARRQEGVQVRLDVGGYRDRREEDLAAKAKEIAEEVLRTGKGVTTTLLRASERRIVHRQISEMPGVTTRALGDGALKKILIASEDGTEEIAGEVDLLGDGGATEADAPPRRGRGGRSEGGPRGGRGRGPAGPRPRGGERDGVGTDFRTSDAPGSPGAPSAPRVPAPPPPPARPVTPDAPMEETDWGRKPKPAKGRRR